MSGCLEVIFALMPDARHIWNTRLEAVVVHGCIGVVYGCGNVILQIDVVQP